MMGVILKQLVGRGDIPEYLREAFQVAKRNFGGRGPQLPDLMGLLKITIASLLEVFICIDALDECLPKHLPELLGSLRDIARELPKMRIFLTGRPHIMEDIQRYFSKAVVVPISPNTDDIRSYLEMKLDSDPEPEAMNDGLRADILRIILEKTSDMCVGEPGIPLYQGCILTTIMCRFLLVSLHIEAILGEVTIRQRKKKLQEMTQGNGLSDAYTATLTRMKAQKGNKSILGLKVLMWVLYSERPLRVEELCHALGVEVGSTDLDHENIPASRTLLASSLGLVTVEASSFTVRLVHFTLQEHLLSDPTLFHSPHSTIAEVCLTYLNFRCVWDLPRTPFWLALETMPLVIYASCYWAEHTRRGITENVKTLALRLLAGFDKHCSAEMMISHQVRNGSSPRGLSWDLSASGFTGLHAVAFHGIVEVVAPLLEMKEWDVNARDSVSCTPLIWAAVRGHEEVVKMLLEREDVNPNLADHRYCQTPLLWAVEQRCDAMVKVLLEREGVNPDQAEPFSGNTPLLLAAELGHEGIVKMLLEREDVNPNRIYPTFGGTSLAMAALKEHEAIVKMFLERQDVNPDLADTEYGRTPLSYAAEEGNEWIVKMLLEREDVNPNRACGGDGATPLWLAAWYGHKEVVKMLLECEGINPNLANNDNGRTPLSQAAKYGNGGIVKMLLERNDVRIDTRDNENQTPLSLAGANGHDKVARMISERASTKCDTADPGSQASLPLLAGHGGVYN